MITFTLALLFLVAGYFIYGAFVERVLAPDYNKQTPAIEHPDGVDFIPLPTWKIFMIQFLNIAGLGPIFGAIMGSQFGTASYLWIVLGTIFAGAVHDFLSGMISLNRNGASLPEIIGDFLGQRTKKVFCVFSIVLLVLVGAVFVSGPAELLAGMTPEFFSPYFWIVVIFAYYVLATLMPVDTIIGRFYPVFALALLFMAFGLLIMLYVKQPDLPEMWNGFGTKYEKNPIFPMMFVSIACGAISGFHATQSPLMARCMTKVKHGRPIFYGAMVCEGVVALIWAAVATAFFGENGTTYTAADGSEVPYSAAMVAQTVAHDWLGTFGGVLAILGIIFAPITSGDTALRSARLIIADFIHLPQGPVSKRLAISVPLFVVTAAVLVYSLSDPNGFAIIWRYFAWCNQTMSVFTLWAITVFLAINNKLFVITLVPAMFMTAVCTTYLFVAPECFGLFTGQENAAYIIGVTAAALSLILFSVWFNRRKILKTKA